MGELDTPSKVHRRLRNRSPINPMAWQHTRIMGIW